jgi:general secretion pathway protein G
MYKRRIIIVDGFQAQWVLTLLVWVAALLAAFAALLIGPPVWQMIMGDASHSDLETASALLALHDRLWLPLAALFLALALVVIKLTHRVAGPLYRFRVVFGELAKGNLAVSAKIRKNDYLQLECQAIEAMVEQIAGRVKSAQAAVSELQDELATVSTIDPHELARLNAHANAAASALATFRTEQAAPSQPSPAPATAAVPDSGFSLVELLLVSCITMTIAGIAVPALTAALDRARITRAIGDISAVGKEIVMHQVGQGCFPDSLNAINRAALRDPWGRAYSYAVPRAPGGRGGGGSCLACNNACVAPGAARKDKNLVPINADFDLYSMGKDGETAGPLTAAKSKDDIVRGRSGAFVGLASEY